MEGAVMAEVIRAQTGAAVMEMEVPPVTDAMEPTLRTRLEALVETVRARKSPLPLGEQRKSPLPLGEQRKSPLPLGEQRKSPLPLGEG